METPLNDNTHSHILLDSELDRLKGNVTVNAPEGIENLPNSRENEEDWFTLRVTGFQTHGVEAHSTSRDELGALESNRRDLDALEELILQFPGKHEPKECNCLVESAGVVRGLRL